MNGITILIVEDNETLANELKDYLNKYGYTTVTIKDFSNVLNECIKTNPDLILLDINLPFYDGFYWCMQIREYSQIPIIYISSRNSNHDKIMAIAQGGDDFVEKPFNLSILKAKSKRSLEEHINIKSTRNNTLKNTFTTIQQTIVFIITIKK